MSILLYFVIDALDECDDDRNIQVILSLFAEARSLERVQLRIFMTSRPEIPIRYGVQELPDVEHQDFILHNIAQEIVDDDISKFLEQHLKIIRRECQLAVDWPGAHDIRRLVQSANGLFIWAATACRFIRRGKLFAADQLSIILKDDYVTDYSTDETSTTDSAITPEKQLDKIYITVLKYSAPKYRKSVRKKWYKVLKETIGSIILLFSPLSANSLVKLPHATKQGIYQTLDSLHALLDIPEDQNRPLRLHHPSFRDFLLDQRRCNDPNLWVDEKRAHQTLADNCIRLMSNSLKQDICRVDAPGVLVTGTESSRVEECLPPEVQYACIYWSQHVKKSGTKLCDNDQVHQFLKAHLLHWLEALSWMRKVSEGIYAINYLEPKCSSKPTMLRIENYPTILLFRLAIVPVYTHLSMI
ncbi:hypothetical protein K469DRAFT_295663 [Zopfia rhizophila CBS 207.26]|uniref:Nephrocystin 3-like N-terminal domain-containing protein n=1 Tax=Zopfia rhizophila CBS 207.26 TaxID=1314779 RepID=A0A6A6DQ39_9PEZI|nr:hypothetical protein K469DRAFT_295663 [Zopfia rhizophila CBS 207.26]